MVSPSLRKRPDESVTEPAVKPVRETRTVLIKEYPSTSTHENTTDRREWREKKRDIPFSGAKDDRNAPLLADKNIRHAKGERRLRTLPREQPYDYAPPPNTSPLRSKKVQDIGNFPSDDAVSNSSSVYFSPRHQSAKVDPVATSTSCTESYADASAPRSTFTDTGGGPRSTFTDTVGGISSTIETEEEESQAMIMSFTEEYEDETMALEKFKSRSTDEGSSWAGDDSYVPLRQNIAGMSIFLSFIQLAILLIQLFLCGLASIEVNPMIGPFPDAFSEWGGKNAYLLLDGHQYFRLLTPVFLSVGIVHMVSNAFCHLQICATFERQWGSGTWLAAYVIGGMGAVATSCVLNPDDIGVSSSGALMGLFGTKIAQIITYNLCGVHTKSDLDEARVDQLGGVLFGAAATTLFTFLTYVDLSGHLGGFTSGFLAGMLLFRNRIESRCLRFLWSFISFGGIIGGATTLYFILWFKTNPDDELGDACQFFRGLYPEGYDCECMWAS